MITQILMGDSGCSYPAGGSCAYLQALCAKPGRAPDFAAASYDTNADWGAVVGDEGSGVFGDVEDR
jgi:hypothetical protein